jgi:hypothetical protein
MLTRWARLGMVIALLLGSQVAVAGPVTLSEGAEPADPAASSAGRAAANTQPDEAARQRPATSPRPAASPEPQTRTAKPATEADAASARKSGQDANEPAPKRAKKDKPAKDAEDSEMDLLIQELPEWLRPKKASDKPSDGVGYGLENDPAKTGPREVDTVRYSDPARDAQYSSQRHLPDTANYGRDNPVRTVLKMARDVVRHPMTWLAVTVVLILSIFVSALRRQRK